MYLWAGRGFPPERLSHPAVWTCPLWLGVWLMKQAKPRIQFFMCLGSHVPWGSRVSGCRWRQRDDHCVPHMFSIWCEIVVGNRPKLSCLKQASVFIRFIIANGMVAANTSSSRPWLFSRACALHGSDFLKDSNSVNGFNSVVFSCALEMPISSTSFFSSLLF